MTEKEASKPSAQVQFKTHLEVGRGGHPPPPKCTFMSTRVSLSQIGGTCQQRATEARMPTLGMSNGGDSGRVEGWVEPRAPGPFP
eukprot:scaffold43399_cov17-Tisochrysis_lutea.AAC.2